MDFLIPEGGEMRRFAWKESHATVWKANDKGENNREHDWLPVYIKLSSLPRSAASRTNIYVSLKHIRERLFSSFPLLCFTADTNHYDVHSSFTCKAELIVKAGESFMGAKAHEYCTILIALFVYLSFSQLAMAHAADFPIQAPAFSTFYVCFSCLLMANGKPFHWNVSVQWTENRQTQEKNYELKNLFQLKFPAISKDFSSVSEVFIHVHHDWVLSIKLD